MGSIRVGELSSAGIERCLRGNGLGLELASFRCLIRSDTGLLSTPLRLLYQDYIADPEPSGFHDFRVRLAKTRTGFWKDWDVEFDWEGSSPFPPLPLAHTHPLFEWGLNWCVATASGLHTVIHSAVLHARSSLMTPRSMAIPAGYRLVLNGLPSRPMVSSAGRVRWLVRPFWRIPIG